MFISTALAASETTEKAGGTFPPFDPTYFASQLLWLAITFGALYLILDRVVIPRISGVLELRRDRISRDLDETQRLKAEADAAHAAYEHELAEARRNAHSIASEATEKAKKEAADARSKVEADLAEKTKESETRIAEIKAKAIGEVDTIAGDAVADIVTQLIGGKLTKSDIAKAITAVKN